MNSLNISPYVSAIRGRLEWHLLNEYRWIPMPRGIRSGGVCSMDAAIESSRKDARRTAGHIARGKDSVNKYHASLPQMAHT